MNVNDLFPSNFFRASDFPSPRLLTIRSVELRDIDDEDKGVIYFDEDKKGLALNRTNANTLTVLFGEETDGWSGRDVVLYQDDTMFKGRPTKGIRIRPPKPGYVKPAATAPEAQAPAAAPADDPNIPF